MLGDRVGLCREKIGTRELKVPEIIHTNTHTHMHRNYHAKPCSRKHTIQPIFTHIRTRTKTVNIHKHTHTNDYLHLNRGVNTRTHTHTHTAG